MFISKITKTGLLGLILMAFLSCFCCKDSGGSRDDSQEKQDRQSSVSTNDAPIPEVYEPAVPIKFTDIPGRWTLKYSENYGYDFTFNRNYKSVIVLNLNTQCIVFKGVYTIENGNLRINIFEMKQEDSAIPSMNRGFVKAKSSYFLFKAGTLKKAGARILQLKPLLIIIDGNNSDGYFEPVIKLGKTG